MFDTLYDELFYQALRIRLAEERVIQLYPSDKIQSPVHLSIGQEAVAVGACHPMEPEDLVFGSYRGHAFYMAKGGDLSEMFAELYGKATGCGAGKAGSMHLAAPDVGFMGSSAVVASTIPHAVGAALAAKRLRRRQVSIAVFGDGATEEGVYHESLNLAALHRLPVLFLCENNDLAVHSHISARQAYRITEHAATYGIPVSYIANGWDFMEIRGAVARLLDEIRATGEPRFIEIKTFRYREHVGPGEDFHAGYRDAAGYEAWRRNDPLCVDTERVARFTPAIEQEIDKAVAFAEASPWPGAEALLADVI